MRFGKIKQARFHSLDVQENLWAMNTSLWGVDAPTCSAPIFFNGLLLITDCVNFVMITLSSNTLVSSYVIIESTYPTALSAKFRMYFLDSTLPLTASATCLMLPTRSTTYADRPLTFSRCIQGVLRIAAKAGSQAVSSSRRIAVMHVDMTLSRIS